MINKNIIKTGIKNKKKNLYIFYPWSNDKKHPAYWYGYYFIGMYDGWISFDKKLWIESVKILEKFGWVKWI